MDMAKHIFVYNKALICPIYKKQETKYTEANCINEYSTRKL